MPALPYPDAHTPKLLTAVTTNTPARAGGALYVQIPSTGDQTDWPVRNWEPHGSTLPPVGANCLVALDENNDVWVLSWIGGWS